MQTELDLLMLAIEDNKRTQVAFAEMLDMTRQGLNKLINKAKKNEGKLNPKFVRMLKDSYQIDIYQYIKREPTLDFYSSKELESVNKLMMAADREELYLSRKTFDHLVNENDHLLKENTALRNRLRDCEQSLAAQKKKGRNSA